MDYANSIFNNSENPNILLYNSMIKGYSLNKPFEEALRMFLLMKQRGIWPDEYTYAPLFKACCNLVDVRVGQCVHGEVLRLGFACHQSIRIGVVELYTSCGGMGDAMKVFDEMRKRDVIIWNLVICGFCKTGNVDMGLYLFRQMSERSAVTWNSMISSLSQSGRYPEALQLFQEMREQCLELDEATIVSVLPACARVAAIDVGKWIHSYVQSSGLFQDYIAVGNSLVDFYCKSGMLEPAKSTFNEMPSKNVVSWNTMISGMAFNGEARLGVELFEQMMSENLCPNDETFVGVLTCCAHADFLEKGRDFFSKMTEKYNMEPKSEHYGCMVDLLGRRGCVREAYELIRVMPMSPTPTLWGSLLSACRTHGDTVLAEVAVKELVNLEPWNSGNYVLLANIYAKEGKWDEAQKVRMLMNENSVQKAPGWSAVG
ncbi:hypothetical protein ACFE04_005536 [Oxalis oulophora]